MRPAVASVLRGAEQPVEVVERNVRCLWLQLHCVLRQAAGRPITRKSCNSPKQISGLSYVLERHVQVAWPNEELVGRLPAVGLDRVRAEPTVASDRREAEQYRPRLAE